MIWDPFERVLWGIAISIYFIGGFLYLKRGKERENSNERILLYGFGGFLFCVVVFLIFRLTAEYFIPGELEFNFFYGDYGNIDVTYEILMKLSWISYLAGFMWHFLTVEFALKRTKYIPTIISIASIVVYIVIPLDLINTYMIFLLILSIHGFIWFAIMILFINQSRSEFKIVASYIITAATFETIGLYFGMQQLKELNLLPIWLSPLFFCLGGIFFIIPMQVNPRFLSKSKSYWLAANFSTIGMYIFMLIFVIFVGLPIIYVGMVIFMFIFLVYIQYIYFRSMKSQLSPGKISEISNEDLNVLRTFVRPEKITEEEVIFHKEKKICLVCKTQVSRVMYSCPECSALYCIKCSDALSNLENACWVCNTSFNDTKPSRPYEKEKEEELVDKESVHNNNQEKQGVKTLKKR